MARTRMLVVLTLLALACSAPSPPASVPSSERTPEHNQVKEAIEQYYRDLSARDWDAFASHFWPDARLTTIWQAQGQARRQVNSVTVEQFVERAPEGPGSQPIFEERLLAAEVRVFGPLAQVWARYEAKFGSEEKLVKWRGIDAFSLLRHDGRWRIASIAYAAEE